MSSLPNTPAEWRRRKAARMALRDWIDAAAVIGLVIWCAWLAGRYA
jgi:hypothetical protein